MNKLIIFTMFLVACEQQIPQATPITKDNSYCQLAEDNLKKLNCIPTNEPYTKKGLSFSQFCVEVQRRGMFVNPKCLAEMKTCDEEYTCLNPDGGVK